MCRAVQIVDQLFLPLEFSLAVGTRRSHKKKRSVLVATGNYCSRLQRGVAPWSQFSAPARGRSVSDGFPYLATILLAKVGAPSLDPLHLPKVSKIASDAHNASFPNSSVGQTCQGSGDWRFIKLWWE